MGADKSDQPGVLGNLPRSRPGQRSEKRGGPRPAVTAAAAKPAATRKPATGRKPAAGRKRASTARKPASTARKPAAAAPRREPTVPEPAPSSPDPLTFAFRTAGKVAELGLKTAGGILRRLSGR